LGGAAVLASMEWEDEDDDEFRAVVDFDGGPAAGYGF
jgi:hypothetical protein